MEYFFISGSDQYNPNIYALFDNGREKVWKDYSIANHLLLHNFYAVERDYLEYFQAPLKIKNKIIYATKLSVSNISATKIRFSNNINKLYEVCTPLVSNEIINKRLWGYRE